MKAPHPRQHIRWKLILLGMLVTGLSMLMASALAPRLCLLLFRQPAAQLPELFRWSKYLLTLLFFALLANFFMSIGQENVVNRILLLSQAAKQIAAGNFDVQITEVDRLDEVYHLSQDFNLMAKQLKQNEYLRKDFISNVSHELKTPLAVIQGYADLLADPRTDTESASAREYAAIISKESRRLLNLTTNMLQISRLDKQKIPAGRSVFRLDEQLRQVILLLEPKWTAGRISIDLQLQECRFYGNEELLEQVWVNLLDNAVKFSPPGSAILVSLQCAEQQCLLVVEDHGEGMSEETLQRIFEQFYQGESSHSEEGSGLGMPIVKRIVQLHQGTIAVHSRPGAGTRVEVSLPLQQQL